MATKKKSIWITYDLGLKGNYSVLFTFLDNHKAIECGDGSAYFIYESEEALTSDDLIMQLKQELKEVISVSSDRIYAIWRDDDEPSTKVKGRFLFGSRKTPPWNGYSNLYAGNQEDEAF